MTTLGLLQYRWRRRWRSGATQLVLRAVALGLVGAYVAVLIGWMGSVFPETLTESGVQRAPSRVLNAHLMGAFAGLLAVRFVFQRFDGSGWCPFLSLPVSRSDLARAIQLASAVSLLNLFPLVGLAVLLYSTVAPVASVGGALLWAAGTLLTLWMTHLAHTLFRAAWSRRAWGVVLGLVVAVVGLIGADVYGVAWVRDASSWLFGGLQGGALLPLAILGAATVGMSRWSAAALRRHTYDWVEGSGRARRRRRFSLDVRGQDPLSSLVLLEAKLILRNRGPREQVLAGIIGIGFFVVMIAGGGERLAAFTYVMAPLLLGQLLTVGYGQFLFAWHGGYFDGLLVHRSPRRLVRAAVVVLLGFAVGPALAALPVVLWAEPFLAVPMLAFALYNAGVAVPLVVWAGVRWNRRWVNPELSRFSWMGGGPVRGILFFFLLCAPPLGMSFWGSLPAVLWGAAGIGLVGLGTIPFWLPRLEAALRRRRHAMLRGFRGPWLSPDEWDW